MDKNIGLNASEAGLIRKIFRRIISGPGMINRNKSLITSVLSQIRENIGSMVAVPGEIEKKPG